MHTKISLFAFLLIVLTFNNEVRLAFADGYCAIGWTAYAGHCYRVINAEVNVTDAQTACQKAGAYLAQISDASEDTFIKGLIAQAMPNPPAGTKYIRYAIGMTLKRGMPKGKSTLKHVKKNKIISAQWADESPITFGNPTMPGFFGKYPWADRTVLKSVDEPKISSIHANCVAMLRNGVSAGDWAAQSCSAPGGYICEYASGVVGETILTVNCPPGATPFNGSCYTAALSSGTVEDAAQKCAESSGWLASIESSAENTFMQGLLSRLQPSPEPADSPIHFKRFFVGMTLKVDASGGMQSFTWANGRDVVYGSPAGLGFMLGDAPWSDGTPYPGGVMEPKKVYGMGTTPMFVVKNSKTAGVWAVAAAAGLPGGYICQVPPLLPASDMKTFVPPLLL